ncbi:ComF family protein [Gordonia sp. SL306]|uniref:ComF family protein n=1 Tax=Gordonia sp. SL306 TaxID=2995145 RepID=UPI00227150E8|nr:ComF family protein [Gordonia sp. SL306]WAC56405.1 ComF family protein [Gordonia sp. SL306]
MSVRRRSPTAVTVAEIVRSGSDLVVPVECGGCSAPGVRWCSDCATALTDDPIALSPRVDVGVDTWALGRYRGPYRAALIAMKEQGRRDLTVPVGTALARGIATLARWGEFPDARDLTLVPAPTRRSSARRRGGDPVTALARVAATRLGARVRVSELLVTTARARDSAGLDARRRVRNLSGSITLRRTRTAPRGTILLVDDVLTTGATASESVRVLARHGWALHAVIVVAGA